MFPLSRRESGSKPRGSSLSPAEGGHSGCDTPWPPACQNRAANPEQEAGEAPEAGAKAELCSRLPSRAGLCCGLVQRSAVREVVLAPVLGSRSACQLFLANWIQRAGKSSPPSLCPPFTLPRAFPSAASSQISLLLGEAGSSAGCPVLQAAQGWALFVPIKFLVALRAGEGDGEDKGTARCVAAGDGAWRRASSSSPEPGRGFSTAERTQPGCGFGSGAGRAAFPGPAPDPRSNSSRKWGGGQAACLKCSPRGAAPGSFSCRDEQLCCFPQ